MKHKANQCAQSLVKKTKVRSMRPTSAARTTWRISPMKPLLTHNAEQMRQGTIAVRDALGNDVPGITDKDIQEALWHYYYDLDKSVTYLLQKSMPKEENKKKTKGGSLFL